MTVNAPNLLMLVAAVQGAVLSALLLFSKRNRRVGNVLLALLLVFYTLPLLKVTLLDLGFFRSYGLWPWAMELLYGLGPSLFLYSKTVTDPQYRLSRWDLAHFLPVVVELGYYLSPLYLGNTTFALTPVESPGHLIWMIQQVGAMLSILVYLTLTHRRLWAYSKWLRSNYSDLGKRTLRWLQTPVLLYTVFFVLWLMLRAVDVFHFGDSLPPPVYYPLMLFLSLSTYWIGTQGFLKTEPVPSGFSQQQPAAFEPPEDDPGLEATFRDLQRVMSLERPHLRNDLSLPELAECLAINPRILSRVINTQAGMNFYDFVNQYRVDEFKERLEQPGAPRRTLLDLAHDCGFGSKATFNHVFKRQTGMTPSQYRKQQLTEPSAEDANPGDTP